MPVRPSPIHLKTNHANSSLTSLNRNVVVHIQTPLLNCLTFCKCLLCSSYIFCQTYCFRRLKAIVTSGGVLTYFVSNGCLFNISSACSMYLILPQAAQPPLGKILQNVCLYVITQIKNPALIVALTVQFDALSKTSRQGTRPQIKVDLTYRDCDSTSSSTRKPECWS